jgi:hypothetical protein
MRTVLIAGSLAIVAAIIWLAASAPPSGQADSVQEPAKAAAGDGQSGDAINRGAQPQATAAHPSNWAEATPSPKGSARNGFLRYPSRAVEGGIESLTGAVRVHEISKTAYTQGADSSLSLSVEGGKVRAYLQYFPDTGSAFRRQDGYVFAEATAGSPGSVDGLLAWGGGSGETDTYQIVFESLDGEATGIRYRITPRQ